MTEKNLLVIKHSADDYEISWRTFAGVHLTSREIIEFIDDVLNALNGSEPKKHSDGTHECHYCGADVMSV